MLNWSIYLCHKTFLSIQHHTLRHTDQSRDYREFGHCNVLRTVDYSWYRTILFLHSVHTEDWLLSKAVKHYCNDTELKLHLKFGVCWFTIHNLTCSTIHSSQSRFTREARSVLYETRAVITVCGTTCVTVSAVDTSIIASCMKLKINYTRYLQKNMYLP